MAKKDKLSWVNNVLELGSGILDKIVEHSDAKITEIKKKTIHYVIVYGIFVMSLFFLLIGLVKYLAESYLLPSEGIAFMVMGSIMVVGLSVYNMFHRL